MQTFLPHPSFRVSAHVLDRQRLGKQRSECLIMLRALAGTAPTKGWRNHPAVLMWEGYEPALCQYMNCVIEEWAQRGYENYMLSPRTVEGLRQYELPEEWASVRIEGSAIPAWLGYEPLHSSHRAALLMKQPPWYRQFGWREDPEVNYFWPGRAPAPGDYLIQQDGYNVAALVLGENANRDFIVVEEGEILTVKRELVYKREWERAIRL